MGRKLTGGIFLLGLILMCAVLYYQTREISANVAKKGPPQTVSSLAESSENPQPASHPTRLRRSSPVKDPVQDTLFQKIVEETRDDCSKQAAKGECKTQIATSRMRRVQEETRNFEPNDFRNTALLKNRIASFFIEENKPYREILPYLDRGLELGADDPEMVKLVLAAKGVSALKQEIKLDDKSLDEIEVLVDQAVDLKSDWSRDAIEMYAATLAMAGRQEDLQKVADRYESSLPALGLFDYLRAASFNKTGQRSEAVALLESALRKEPGNERYATTLKKISDAPGEGEVAGAFTLKVQTSIDLPDPDLGP